MINFAVGPVESPQSVLALGALDSPYFRTGEFSEVVLESERILLSLLNAPEGSRVCFVTGSGTAAMESVVASVLNEHDHALVVDGGSFGHRFRQMLELHGVPHEAIELIGGTPLERGHLPINGYGSHTALLVNIHETSTGILYDAELLADYCRENDLLFIVDAISSFLADPLDMSRLGADVVITGSQKALACPPGVSVVVLSPRAQERIENKSCPSMYLSLGLMLENGVRGQTPFTPAVTIILQIHQRLREIEAVGIGAEICKVASIAALFRREASELPFEMRLTSPSNAATYCTCDFSARDLFERLKEEYGIWICPNGGPHADTSFRVGHIGALERSDVRLLIAAMHDLNRRGFMTRGGE